MRLRVASEFRPQRLINDEIACRKEFRPQGLINDETAGRKRGLTAASHQR
jgi:hypothetical protein